MSGSESLPPTCWPSYFTGEYARLGVSVNDNMGLSAPVAVNALTGVMHAVCWHDCKEGLVCDCPTNLPLPDGPQRHREVKQAERDARFGLSMCCGNYAVIRSLSSVAFRACRNCEKIVKANKRISSPDTTQNGI